MYLDHPPADKAQKPSAKTLKAATLPPGAMNN
jgi:hypothetical protein